MWTFLCFCFVVCVLSWLGRRCRYHHSIFFFPIWLFVLFGNMNMDLYLLDLVLLTICFFLITVVRIELSFLEWMFCWWSSCFCILALLEWEIVIIPYPDMSNQFRPKLSNSTPIWIVRFSCLRGSQLIRKILHFMLRG